MSPPPPPARPVLSGLYHVVPVGDDRVQVCNAGRFVMLRGSGGAQQLCSLLAAMDGSVTTAELEARFPGTATEAVAALAARGIVVDVDRAAAAASGRGAVAERLRPLRVAVDGCGPVGAQVAVLLASAGVGSLLLHDPAAVTARDIERSAVLAGAAGAEPRAATVARLCAGASRTTRCAVVDGPGAWAGRVDMAVVEGRFTPGGVLPAAADAALEAGTPYVVHSQDALQAVVGPVVHRGGSPCHRCLETRRASHVVHAAEDAAYLAHRAAHAPEPDAFQAAHVAVVGGAVAAEVLRALVDGAGPVAAGAGVIGAGVTGAIVVDLAAMAMRRESVPPVPGCAGCATAPAAAPPPDPRQS